MDKDVSKFTCLWKNDFSELAIDLSPQSSSIEIKVQIEELICLWRKSWTQWNKGMKNIEKDADDDVWDRAHRCS